MANVISVSCQCPDCGKRFQQSHRLRARVIKRHRRMFTKTMDGGFEITNEQFDDRPVDEAHEIQDWTRKDDFVMSIVFSGCFGVIGGISAYLIAGEYYVPYGMTVGAISTFGASYKLLGEITKASIRAARWMHQQKLTMSLPTISREEPLKMIVTHEHPDRRPAWEIIDVPLNGPDKEANLRRYNELCIGTLQGRPFTYAEWTPLSTLLSRNEFDKVRQHWLDLSIVRPLDDGQLYLLPSGKRTLAGLLRAQGIEPGVLVDGDRGISSLAD